MEIDYEYPLPCITTNIKQIKSNVCGILEGNIIIENISEGVLCGNIFSDIPYLSFAPSIWEDNICEVTYTYDSQYLDIGTIIEGRVIIDSNGGEIVIPVTFNIVSKEILVEDKKIYNIDTFTEYAKTNFLKAKEIFTSKDFLKICNITDSNLCKLYNRLSLDVYKEISLDNFLIVSGKKQSAKIIALKPKTEIIIKCFESRKIKCEIPLQISGWGTIEATISSKQKWIEILNMSISNNNVSNGQILENCCIIDTKLITSKISRGYIEVISDSYSTELEIIIKKENIFDIQASKNYYYTDDTGNIKITNNMGTDIMVEIYSDKCIKFKSKKYFISTYAEIPFEIKLPISLDLIKAPVYDTTIIIKMMLEGKQVKKYLNIKISNTPLD